jgi:hypothetical protein
LTVYSADITAYNLQIGNIHTYYAGTTPVLVHNSCGEPPPNLSPSGAGRRGAFGQAKRDSGIPRSQEPVENPNLDGRGNVQPGRAYTFDGPDGPVVIRDDAGGHDYGPGDPQNRGPHFNTPNGGHYDY